MPTMQVNIHDPQTDLAGLVALVAAGTEIILTKGDAPVARIVRAELPRGYRVAGLHPGAIETSDDFDGPLPDEFWTGG
jgi:antitoxin (DNA-binding transcriptional repressor) of toxin-antitoxin stability system